MSTGGLKVQLESDGDLTDDNSIVDSEEERELSQNSDDEYEGKLNFTISYKF